MASSTNNIIGNLLPVYGLGPVVPSSSTPDYVSLKNAHSLTVVIQVLNATTVTGSAITLKQATNVSAGSEKALSFTEAWRNIDCAAADGLAKFAVSSDTFTTDSTNSKQLLYVIEVDPATLDSANGFDCVRVGTGNATAATVAVMYYVKPRSINATGTPTLITD